MAGRDYARPPRDTLIRRLTGGSWLSHYQELSGFAARTGRALAKNAALLGIADLLRNVGSKTRENATRATTHNFAYIRNIAWARFTRKWQPLILHDQIFLSFLPFGRGGFGAERSKFAARIEFPNWICFNPRIMAFDFRFTSNFQDYSTFGSVERTVSAAKRRFCLIHHGDNVELERLCHNVER